jgi:hypothetical protein
MQKSATTFLALAALMLALAPMTASAQQTIGGHNETSEAGATQWATSATPNPGTVPVLTGSHLLLTEVIVTPTTNELIEIHNPGLTAVDLSKYYLTDSWFSGGSGVVSYHSIPAGPPALGSNTDFIVKFPAGASIPAGGTIVVAVYGPGVDSTFGAGTADYEITSVSGSIPDMVNASTQNVTANATTLTNGNEFIMLFFWDGASDNVCDVDYVTWGTSSGTSRVDKTGLSVDGPDGDALSTSYNPDTAIASQSAASAPTTAGQSTARVAGPEGAEGSGGNGCVSGGPTQTNDSTWGKIKAFYR